MSRRWLAAMLLGIGSILGGLVAWPAASATPPTAHLVKVHVFKPAGGVRYDARPTPTANCSDETGQTSPTYSFTGWKTGEDSARLLTQTIPTTIKKDGTDAGASATDVESAMQSAFTEWSPGPTPNVSVTDDTESAQTRQTANQQDDLLFGKTPGSAIAATYTWRWSNGMVESDVVFNSRVPWGIVPETGDGCNQDWPTYDVESIAAHEFGHVLGLGHVSTAVDRWNTMYSYGYTGETLKRTLGTGDATGVKEIYTPN